MTNPVNLLACHRDGEKFVFLYDDESLPVLKATLNQYAADNTLNFTRQDASQIWVAAMRLRDLTNFAIERWSRSTH